MTMLITQPAQAIRLPEPRVAIAIRPGAIDDVAFIDALQSKHTKQVGWMPRAQLGLTEVVPSPGPQVLLTVNDGNGIVAVDGGVPWTGCVDVVLPYP